MADSIAPTSAVTREQAEVCLACRLRPKPTVGQRGPLQYRGELELENLSAGAVVIRYQMSPLQYLHLIVTGPSGAVVSEGHFGDRFSPMAEERELHLRPREKFVADIPLLGTVPREKRVPGAYKVQASYEYGTIKAVSAAIDVTV
jgi:hypothetical protein